MAKSGMAREMESVGMPGSGNVWAGISMDWGITNNI
jgi:hypothetical protein